MQPFTTICRWPNQITNKQRLPKTSKWKSPRKRRSRLDDAKRFFNQLNLTRNLIGRFWNGHNSSQFWQCESVEVRTTSIWTNEKSTRRLRSRLFTRPVSSLAFYRFYWRFWTSRQFQRRAASKNLTSSTKVARTTRRRVLWVCESQLLVRGFWRLSGFSYVFIGISRAKYKKDQRKTSFYLKSPWTVTIK